MVIIALILLKIKIFYVLNAHYLCLATEYRNDLGAARSMSLFIAKVMVIIALMLQLK